MRRVLVTFVDKLPYLERMDIMTIVISVTYSCGYSYPEARDITLGVTNDMMRCLTVHHSYKTCK